MNDDEAQNIVYAFVDYVAAGKPYIGDASTLAHPKETIRQAFYKHLEHYESMRRISDAAFRQLGYDKTVEQLCTMLAYLDDWQDIDPEDKEAVHRLNEVEGLPPEWGLPLIAKYFGRAAGHDPSV